MAFRHVIGVYGSMARARLAQEALIVEGMPEAQVAISVDLTEDGIAAEAPGQSYENQPSDRAAGGGGWAGSLRTEERREAQYGDAARRGVCVVTAEARTSSEADWIREIMQALRPVDVKPPLR